TQALHPEDEGQLDEVDDAADHVPDRQRPDVGDASEGRLGHHPARRAHQRGEGEDGGALPGWDHRIEVRLPHGGGHRSEPGHQREQRHGNPEAGRRRDGITALRYACRMGVATAPSMATIVSSATATQKPAGVGRRSAAPTRTRPIPATPTLSNRTDVRLLNRLAKKPTLEPPTIWAM